MSKLTETKQLAKSKTEETKQNTSVAIAAKRRRIAEVSRKTTETDVSISLNLDGEGKCEIATGIGFLDHMLTLLAKHGFMDLTVKAEGDLEVDSHHTVEDIGIVLGEALKEALGDKAGIHRYGNIFIPMDETLAQVCLDFSGRPFLVFDAEVPKIKLGNYETEMTEEFFRAVAMNCGLTVKSINPCFASKVSI